MNPDVYVCNNEETREVKPDAIVVLTDTENF
jgi:hypothetical protein